MNIPNLLNMSTRFVTLIGFTQKFNYTSDIQDFKINVDHHEREAIRKGDAGDCPNRSFR